MSKFMLGLMAAFAVTTFSATAQITGPDLLRGVSDRLGSEKVLYRVEVSNDGIRLTDPASGREVLSMREVNSQQLSISGTIGQLSDLSTEVRQKLVEQIALFNFSSAVGTIVLDEESGEITMHHNVNPRVVTASAIAQVASRFGDSVVEQSRVLAQ
jgi:hypothetical protein